MIVSDSNSDAGKAPLYEESFVLLEAASEEEVMEKARACTAARTECYRNVYGDLVTWTPELVQVGEVVTDTFADGSELYARFFHNKEAYEHLDFEDFSKDE